MDAMADDVAAWLDRLGIERAVVGGFSMGGYVALAFARRHPRRLEALALVGSRAVPDAAEARAGRMALAARVRREGTGVLAETMLPKLLGDRPAPLVEAAVRAQVLATSPEGAAAALEGMAARPDRTAVLADLQVPALVVAAREDAVVPLDEARGMAEVARGRFVEVPGPHLAPLVAPAQVGEALHDWLRTP